MAPDAAVTGLGITELTRAGDVSVGDLAIEASRRAVDDAGLPLAAIDGLLMAHSPIAPCEPFLHLQNELGLGDLAVLQDVHSEGSSAMQLLHNAALYVAAGRARHVLCVFADAPVATGASAGANYFVSIPHGQVPGWEAAHGFFGAAGAYGLCARRHMTTYGTTTEHLGAVAVSARGWAAGNPLAVKREPLTVEEHHASPWVADPFRRLDCAFPVNGGAAFVVSSRAGVADTQRRPVFVAGIGQGHRANWHEAGSTVETSTGAVRAGEAALEMAGLGHADIDVCQLYDCFSYVTIALLEDLGFCPKGEGGPFVVDGNIDRGGSIPTNTGGGQLSGYYLQGMTPITEAIIQLRGDGGERQVDGAEAALVHAHGGILNYHTCSVLTTDGGIP